MVSSGQNFRNNIVFLNFNNAGKIWTKAVRPSDESTLYQLHAGGELRFIKDKRLITFIGGWAYYLVKEKTEQEILELLNNYAYKQLLFETPAPVPDL